jgi:GR25 family glycosyltransferase involved in LPS biosynthesis
MGSNFCENIDKIIYINLDSREDRKKHILEHLEKYNVPNEKIIRFSAIKNKIGAIGCSSSHISVIEMAIKNKWNNILILEDDFVFNIEPQKLNVIINLFFKLFGKTYDIFQLTYWFDCRVSKTNYDGFFKVIGCDTTSGYFINSRFYEILFENFKNGVDLLKKNSTNIRADNYSPYNLDEYWKKIQPLSNWYIYLPTIGKQLHTFFSDIRNEIPTHNIIEPKIINDIEIHKYKIDDKSTHILNNIFKQNKTNSYLFKITDYGVILNNYQENNHKLFRIDDTFLNTDTIQGIISFYLNHNKWKVQNQKNNTLDKLNRTLAYALKTTGTIYEIKFTDAGPVYTLYTNTDYINENGFFIDGNTKYNVLMKTYRWIVYVTDYFNLYYIYFYKKGEGRTIFLNHCDTPILQKNKIEEIDSNYPIYSWTTTKDHADVLLPFPDIIMWLFKREFYSSVDPSKFIKFKDKTNNKCVFRGNMTNELRIKAHVVSLQNKNIFDFITSNSNKLIFSNNQMLIDDQNIENFNNDKNNYLTTIQQQAYKYILNIDGVASAWRIISELYYNSVIFMHESPYIDVIRESMQKNIHYIEIKSDLSNIKDVYNFVANNDEFANKIVRNINILSQKLNNIDVHMKLMYEKIEKKKYNCTYNDLINIKYDIPEQIYDNACIEEQINTDNIYIDWKCYINNDVFSKKLVKNMNDNKNKYVLCRPEAGFVDMLHAISACYRYCQTFGRTLLIDTSNTTTYKINFSDFFNISHNKKFLEPNIICDKVKINEIIKNNLSIYPKTKLDSDHIYSEDTNLFYDNNNVALQFNFNIDYDEDILYYRQHRKPEDKLNDLFLKNIKLDEKYMLQIYEKFKLIPKPYLAIHIRNTDMKSDYIGVFERKKNLISQFENVYLATDSIEVLNYFKENIKNLFYYTEPIEDNKPIHYNHANEITTFTDLLTDIFICNEASYFISGNMRSGFSQFIQYIREKSIGKSIFDITKIQNNIISKNISNKKQKIYFLSFGGGTGDYHQAVERIGKQAESFGIFDEIICMTDLDLQKDKEFWEKHKNFILNNKRGYGYWIWKPYLIHKIMTERMNDGDIIFYADSGCELNILGRKRFLDYIDIVNQNETLAFQMDLLEKQWTKMDLIKILKMEDENTGQIQATMQFYTKCKKNIDLLEQIYKLSIMMNYRFVDDSPSIETNDKSFKEHRHEQSILSLLFKKNNCYYIKDETYFYPIWNDGIKYPIWSIRNRTGKRYINNYIDNYMNDDISVKKQIYRKPCNISKYHIYDIFYSNNRFVIVSPAELQPFKIQLIKNKELYDFILINDPHNHTYIYLLESEYLDKIEIIINNEKFLMSVNKYPEFNDKILMSTIVKNEDNYILQWINYHMSLGIEKFIIYDNSPNETLGEILHELIKKNIVLLINWTYPYMLQKSGISGQTTQQNHSLYAFKKCKYIGFFDIDEYVNPQTNQENINNLFDNLIKMKNLDINKIGSFRLLNKFFYNPNNMPTTDYNFLSIYNCDNITKFGREKNFVVPQNVDMFSVHMITLGHQMYTIDEKILFFNHYLFLNKKDRGNNKTDLIDDSISKKRFFLDKHKLSKKEYEIENTLKSFKRMKFIFFYSPIYNFYNEHIKAHLENIFDIEGILINDIPTQNGHTFFGGVSIKIELIINKIKENIGNYIFFTDATIFINKNNTQNIIGYINQYKIYDICFADNNINSDYNIGVIMINCNEKTLNFFEVVLEKLVAQNGWDQYVVNNVIDINKTLNIGKFDKKIYCGYTFDKNMKHTFYIYKSFIKHTTNLIDNYNQRIEIFYDSELISYNEYINLKK